jgi:hypothetical protein
MANKTKKQIKAEIKEMEAKKRQESEIKVDVAISFDSWFHRRSERIPKGHYKEVIAASFRSMKVPMMATIAEFDEALAKYGLKI